MVRRLDMRFALLTLLTLVLPSLLTGQIPPRLKRCLPYPTLADEIQQLTEQSSSTSAIPDENESEPHIIVDSVTIRGGHSLPKTIRQRLIASARQPHWYSFDADRLNEFQEVGVRGALQSAGYFKAVVRVEGQILSSNTNSQHVAITIHIEEGPRFYLSSLKLRAANPDSESLPFPYEVMRTEIALQEGALFGTSKIKNGIESLTQLFQADGYIDFTAEPQLQVDEKSHRIALTLVLDPQKQYRLAQVEILGPDPACEKLLQSQWKVGDVFNRQKLDTFLQENKSLLPSDASEQDIRVLGNTMDGTVDLKFDFRECSSTLSTEVR
jgi:outer membrane protein assembly factor BamA